MASPDGGPARGAAIRTFLIADIRGYTRFTAQHGDEAASRLTTTFAEIALGGVEAWGGALVELRGDEALGVFDSPRQALRAAIELGSAFADETATEPALPLPVGIGLDIGEAVPVGPGYRGAALNLAARLCAIAGPGEVLASEGLIRLVGPVEGLTYATLEPTAVKGYDEPIAAVRVEGSGTARRPAAPGSAPGSAPAPSPPPPLPPELDPIVPLAGREPELRWLAWHWRRARHGHGRTLVLSGPPGIGKTRLAAELATIAHDGGATVLYVPAVRLADRAPSGQPDALTGGAVLTILDDVDAAAGDAVGSVVDRAHDVIGRPGMLLVIHRREAAPQVLAAAERLAPPEQRRTIGPIDSDAVRAIVALYAGHAVERAPIGALLDESGGVPAAVHRVASHWARTAAAGRLEASAGRTAAGRRGLRDAEAALMDDVADLEMARERDRLYGTDAAEETGPRVGSRTVCPYKGLAAFEATDADYYFGRERLIAELIARSVGGSFLGLVGDSGSGKSSALRAGLLSALASGVLPGSETWPQALLRPGEHPLDELGRALARAHPERTLPADDPSAALDAALAALAPGQRLVVVVDQFEEVFNATRDDAERSAFIDVLTGGRPGLKVIVAIRADHYGRCAAYPALARLLGSDQVLVGPLSGTELGAVIEHPAQRVGLRVEPALTEALVADAGTEPGVLPLLETALLELWGARDAGRLTLAAYRASGGLEGAIARLAEATYAELDPHRQSVARAILLRLAGPGEGAELVRRRVPLGELDADRDPTVAEVLETLTAARLLTAGEGHVEVAHEALLREWPRLQGWLEEDAAGRQVRLHLIGAVADWEGRGRETGDLYRGARLAAALDWAAEHPAELNATERAFLDAGREATEREVERQRRTNRRLRMLLAGAAALLVVAVGAGGVAVLQGQRATDEARNATDQKQLALKAADQAKQEALNARSKELLASAIAARDRDASLAKLLAVDAMNVVKTPTYQSTSVLHTVLAADPIIARYSWPADKPVGAGALFTDLSSDGKLLVATGTARFEVADPLTGRVLWSWPRRDLGLAPGTDLVSGGLFSADGTEVIAGLWWGDPDVAPPAGVALGVAIWNAQTGELMRTIDVGPCGAAVPTVSRSRVLVWTPVPGPDGRTGCHWPDGSIAPVWVLDLSTSSRTLLAERATYNFGNGTLSGDGRFVGYDVIKPGACGRSCVTSVVVDLDQGRMKVFEHEADPNAIGPQFARQLNGDGSLLLYGDRPTFVYRIGSGATTLIATWAGTGGGGDNPVFDPKDQTVLQTSRDGTLRRWDPTTGQVLASWSAVGSGPTSVALDGRTLLVTNAESATAVLLDIGARGDIGQVQSCPGFTMGGSLKAHGTLAAFGERCDGSDAVTVQIVDLQQRTSQAWSGWWSQDLALSPDGGSFVSQEYTSPPVAGALEVASMRTGAPTLELQGTCRWDSNSLIPPDRQPPCQTFPKTPFAYGLPSEGLHWSPDGTMIAAVSNTDNGDLSGHLVVWNAHDGTMVHEGATFTDRSVASVMFTPDSTGLVVSYMPTGVVEVLSTKTWTPVTTATLDPSIFGVGHLGFVGFTPDGSTILAVGSFGGSQDSTLIWLDPVTLKITKAVPHAHTASVKSMALSPHGSLIATGASDGLLRIWDTKTGDLKQQMDFGGREVQGIAFIDDEHLAVTPQGGDLLLMTVDPAELLTTVRASLTRSFTDTECTTYGISPCPTLAQVRAGG